VTDGPDREGGNGNGGGTVAAATEWFSTRLGGILVPIAAAVFAFLVGGLAIVATGHSPFGAYRAMFEGTGLNYVFPWLEEAERARSARNLQQTLIVATPLILTGLAVAFAFRCGMFNIGGQGQYWVGLTTALFVGTQFELPGFLHVPLAIVAAILAGAVWGGIAGLLKATVGAHEVISTIMLNWIAVFGGKYLFELNGPLQGPQEFIPRSGDVLDSARLPAIWGTLQPLHAGIFVSLAALVVYHLLLNRTTLGYEVRAVGFNPEAARYGGISVSRNYFLAMAIAGTFAGLAGALDLLGWKFRVATNDFDVGVLGFVGIAVALLGRNKAIGILLAGLFFAALQVGTSTRQLDPTVFPPALAVNLATIIQALIILFVGAELLILSIWGARRYLRGPRRVDPQLVKPGAGE
jgi:general nucleoside transport system permease protein